MKLLVGLAIVPAVGIYAFSVKRDYDELGQRYVRVYDAREALAVENANLKKMYTDLRKEHLARKGDRP